MEDTGKDSQQPLDWATETGKEEVKSASPYSPTPPAMTEEERLELQEELAKVEDEIQTLSQVLLAKEKQVASIKKKLGITPLNELKQSITKTWQDVTTSTVYRRTTESFTNAGLKATTAFSTMSCAIGKRLDNVRNTASFKTLEGKVENLKIKMNLPNAPASPSSRCDQDSTPASESLLAQPEGPSTQERMN